ncbi:hypothetical protein VNI00_010264 [Paramarasmius palmivorus]|uniref:Uncharacterized protein n=1 Tax=Paramarasmius palmivorus TaxID=297713 RepID=A0AAW0CJ66_9AGAR
MGQDNMYGCAWGNKTNAMELSYNATAQTSALQVLIGGINFFNETNQSVTSSTIPFPTSSSTPRSHSSRKTPVAIIAGSVAGGVSLFILIAVLVYILRYRRRGKGHFAGLPRNTWGPFFADPGVQVTPFVWSPRDFTSAVQVRTKPYRTIGQTPHIPPTQQENSSATISGDNDIISSVSRSPNPLGTLASETITAVDRRPSDIMMPMGTSLPEMIRVLYFRLWERDGESNTINSSNDRRHST